VRARFENDLGYVSAKVGANAAVFDDNDRILLVRRADDGRFGLLAGWIDPNEDPRDTIVREIAEEAGVAGRVDKLVGVFGRAGHSGYGPHGAVAIVFLCSVDSHDFVAQEHEVLDVSFHRIEDVTEWHHDHESYARAAREAWWRHRAGL
jgi:ADP-ribose pyrophosphatase YjhB (NUDIX family)